MLPSLDMLPNEPATLLGTTTPLNGLHLSGTADGTLTLVVAARHGTMQADPGAGAAVRGGGTNLLWLTGAVEQINAKLAKLTYTGSSAAGDVLSVSVVDSTLAFAPPFLVPITVAPFIDPVADFIRIDGGTLTLDTRLLDGPAISLHQTADSPAAASVILINSVIGTRSTLSSVNDAGTSGPAPRIAIAGNVTLEGAAEFSGGPTLLTLAQGAVLANTGRMHFLAPAMQISGGGTLENNGLVLIDGAGADDASGTIGVTVTGSGVIEVADGASVSVARSVGAGQTIQFDDGASSLNIAQPGIFAATIAGFAPGDRIDLAGIEATSAFFTRTDAAGGELALFDGADLVASLRFNGTSDDARFELIPTNVPAVVSLGMTALPPAAPSSSTLDVFRFFDSTHGTQVLTQDTTERDAIVESRPDLQYEGIGLHAIDPAAADPDAVTVYRFFDQNDGTHLFTASAAERDSILATRPDLLFEPDSTMLEHATPHAGDLAVYRFFDRVDGTHFLTADAGERGTILSTRPDLIDEGIAFYAPSH